MSCASLTSLSLPNTVVTSAEPIHDAKLSAGAYEAPSTYSGSVPAVSGIGPDDTSSLPTFCLVKAVVTTSPESKVGIVLWLPLTQYTGNFLGLGNGPLSNGNKKLAGIDSHGNTVDISSAGLGDGLRRGFAGGSVSSGGAAGEGGPGPGQGGGPAPAGPNGPIAGPAPAGPNGPLPSRGGGFSGIPGNLQASYQKGGGMLLPTIKNRDLLIDYSYRAEHVMTVVGKEIAAAFYGSAPKHSIFIGCSQGSEQAINEAGRYPKDYDGVIIGALMNPIAIYNMGQLWPAWVIAHHPDESLTADDFAIVHKAVLQKCGGPVGRVQGFVEDPERCSFDPAVLQCKPGQTSDCLTAGQVEGVKQFYQGAVDPRTQMLIWPGPALGAEGGYREMAAGFPLNNSALDLVQNGVHRDPNWDFKSMDYDTDIDLARKTMNPLTYVAPAQLAPFVSAGDKLMFYEGWLDYHNAEATFAYYTDVVKADPAARDAMGVYPIPGMGHCDNGPGCDTFDKIGLMLQWLDDGQKPAQFTSYKVKDDGKVIRSRTVCAWPAVSQYNGSGDMNVASSFSCVNKPIPASEQKLFERLRYDPAGFSQ